MFGCWTTSGLSRLASRGTFCREMHLNRPHTPKAYKVCDGLTEALIYFLVVFTPWAFGTTQQWSIWTANAAGYLLGCSLVTKWLIRWRTGYAPSRWGESVREDQTKDQGRGSVDRSQKAGVRRQKAEDRGKVGGGPKSMDHGPGASEDTGQRAGGGGRGPGKWLTRILAALTVFILLYCLIGALNPRATYYEPDRRFEYHDNYIEWLPHSYDPASTWQAFWSYLSLAFFFWGTRDWLLAKTSKEKRLATGEHRSDRHEELRLRAFGHSSSMKGGEAQRRDNPISNPLPDRLRRLLWVLCINGTILALVGILQRLSGTGKLLWLIEPRFNKTNDVQFGPYAYRSNGATYFNLVWPVCVGLWLSLLRRGADMRRLGVRLGQGSHVLLLPCTALMAAAPVISTARGAGLIALGNIIITAGILFISTRRDGPTIRATMLSLFLAVLTLAGVLGWQQLAARLEMMFVDKMSTRTEVYRNSRVIAEEYPVLGTGPGSFGTIYRLYKEPTQTWDAYAHDDWLELKITFGWIGFGAICLMLVIALARWFGSSGIPLRWDFVGLIWVAITGCLVHAKFDFPFQIYSLHLLFLLLCSILFCSSRASSEP